MIGVGFEISESSLWPVGLALPSGGSVNLPIVPMKEPVSPQSCGESSRSLSTSHPKSSSSPRTRSFKPILSPVGLLEKQLDLHPHGTDAAVGEIPIQKVGRRGVDAHALCRNLSELRMVEGIEGLPSKLQPSLLSHLEGSVKAHVKVPVRTLGRNPCCPYPLYSEPGTSPDQSRRKPESEVRLPPVRNSHSGVLPLDSAKAPAATCPGKSKPDGIDRDGKHLRQKFCARDRNAR